MKIFDTRQIREIDEYTIRNEPIPSVNLMERAAMGCVIWLKEKISSDSPIKIFAGPGNNGGDGWAIARLMADRGYKQINLYLLQISQIISPDSVINRKRLLEQQKVTVNEIREESDFPVITTDDVVIDALFGSGLSRPLEGMSVNLIKHINNFANRVYSIDIPSGLMGEDNTANPETGIIKATHTLTFQFPKRSFLFSENETYTGGWYIIPIGLHPDIIAEMHSDYYYLIHADLQCLFKKRRKFSHKGNYGHALLISGSYGMMGAAILAAKACLRSGAGLLTSHVPKSGLPVMQVSVPESICSIDKSKDYFTGFSKIQNYTAVGIGPGIGVSSQTIRAFRNLLNTCDRPMIIDADALNILAGNPEMLELLPENSILTPHPKEFDRIAGDSENGFRRNQRQIEFARRNKVIVVLKGAHTSIALPDGCCYFNSTGNPGMATAGSGDVLTGIILSLLAQGYPSSHAAMLGVFIHGLAGDIAADAVGQQALIASEIINHLAQAFIKFENYDLSC
jgi:hydroxyethylthiazole kinase-like uncharacterized protein yjeF